MKKGRSVIRKPQQQHIILVTTYQGSAVVLRTNRYYEAEALKDSTITTITPLKSACDNRYRGSGVVGAVPAAIQFSA